MSQRAEPLPYLERARIQAEILLPLYRRLKDEIGVERAQALLRESVEEFARGLGREIGEGEGRDSLDKLRHVIPMFSAQDAVELDMLEHSDTELRFNVKRCRYAELFRELGDPEFGRLMVCGIDPPMTAGIGDDLELERSQTLMEGAGHCDFRWTLKRATSA